MLIKYKLFALNALSILSLLLMLMAAEWAWQHLERLNLAEEAALGLTSQLLIIRHHEKDFVMQLKEEDVDALKQGLAEFDEQLSAAKSLMVREKIDTGLLDSLGQSIGDYRTVFEKFVTEYRVIGLDPESGLYGSLREAVHSAEDSVKATGRIDLLAGILQLRRDEKDFMLRLKSKYVDKFQQDYDKLKGQVGDDTRVYESLERYRLDFLQLVSAQERVGFDAGQGLRAELVTSSLAVQDQLEQLQTRLQEILHGARSSVVWKLVALVILIAVLVFLMTFLIARSLNRSLSETVRLIQQVASEHDMTRRLASEGKDEMAHMGRALNSMLDSVSQFMRQCIEATGDLTRATHQLSENADRASAGGRQQLQETEQLATAVTEMVSTIEEIARSADNAAEQIRDMSEHAHQGRTQAARSIDCISTLAQRLEGSTEAATELSQSSSTISSVLDVIRGIAEQTNLLALNAAIEAARAGEQGRGFAVVAGEVRTLAMRTRSATEEIEEIISVLQQKTSAIVVLIEQCRNEGMAGAEQVSRAGEYLDRISENVAGILDMSTQIAAAVEEQGNVAAEINRNVVNIRDVADRAATDARSNAETSSQIAHNTDNLSRAIQRFKC